MNTLNVDIVICGGGIAGLWTLSKLTQHGYNAVLLECDALGAGQTIKSQGIIHGGLKYALSGQLSSAVTALTDMPTLWQQCLHGTGEIDLSKARILATGQHMWSVNKITGGITTLFASSALKSHVEVVPTSQWPQAMLGSAIASKLYKLEELVLDIPSVLNSLATPLLSRCIKVDSEDYVLECDENGNIKSLITSTNGNALRLTAQKYIFTAGIGNAALTKSLPNAPTMQRRPLQMVFVKAKNLLPLYGHCIGLGTTPRMTITTHTAQDHIPVWYLGGKIAEEGVNYKNGELIDFTKRELHELFPNIDLSQAEFACFFVDRAEAKQADGSKPNSITVFNTNNYITAWPTKLALAPLLAQQILNYLQTEAITPKFVEHLSNGYNVAPVFATPIWDQLL